MIATIGFTKYSKTTVRQMESSMNSVTVLPMDWFTCSRSLAPTARPIMTVVPMASPTIMTVSMCMTWLPMETAVVALTPLN